MTSVQIRHLARLSYGDSLPDDRRVDGPVAVYGSNGQVGGHDRANTAAPVIVVGRKGSHGKLQYSEEPVFAIDTTYFVDPRSTDCHMRWLFYALSTLQLDELSFDVGVPGLSREAAYAQRVSRPTLEQQRAIADFLDAETARIDAIVMKRLRMAELLRTRRRTLIIASVSDQAGSRLGIAFPESWTRLRLRALVESVQSGVWGDEPTGERDVRCVRAADFDRWKLRVSSEKLPLRHVQARDLERHRLLHGDLVLEKSGGGDDVPVGAVVLFDLGDSAVSTNFAARVRPARRVSSEYLCLVWMAMYYLDMTKRSIKQTTGLQNLDVGSLLREPWAIPSLDEQRDIVEDFDRMSTAIDLSVDALTRQLHLLREHRQALITAAVTGEIDVSTASGRGVPA